MTTTKSADQQTLGDRAWTQLIIWKLAIIRLLIYSIYVAGVGYLGAMGNQTWASLDGDSRFKLLLGIMLGVIGVWLAFLDKSIANIQKGNPNPPNDNDGTGRWTKRTEEVTVAAGTGAPPPTAADPAAPTKPV